MALSGMINLPVGQRSVRGLSPVTRNALSTWNGKVTPGPLRAAIFDIGNVLANWYPGAASYEICAREGWNGAGDIKKVEDALTAPELKGPFEKGEFDFGVFYDGVNARLGFKNTSKGALERIWNSTFEVRNDSLALACDMQDAGLFLCLMSDTNQQHFAYLQKLMPVLGRANAAVLSHITGSYKCDGPQQYQKAVSLLGSYDISPDQAVYFDDRHDYTTMAISLGIPSLTFLNANDARTVVREIWGLGI